MRYKKHILIFLVVLLAGCQLFEEPMVTPPVVPVPSTTTAVTATTIPATNTPPPSETAVVAEAEAPALPTAVSTDTPTSPPPTATPIPALPINNIKLVPVATEGVARPVHLTHAGDERLFVVQQNGVIRIIQDGVVMQEPFLNIRERVGIEGNEQGLLSLAFHPDFMENGYFYVNYTNANFDTTISRFQVDATNPNLADAASENILLTIEQPFPNHNGGLVKFGPDGYLYIGMGDGGSQGDPQNNGQRADTLLGTILRIDVDVPEGEAAYGVPASNPFIAAADKRNEIWAYGFRNPWRFSFDRETRDLFIADVGQNEWEEVHFQPAASQGGENYGWNILEGSHCYQRANCDTTGLEMPIFEYHHSEGGCSITGGYVYRGRAFPELTGNYLVGDFCSGIIWRLFRGADGVWQSAIVLDSEVDIASFGEDVHGELYVVSREQGIFQIQP